MTPNTLHELASKFGQFCQRGSTSWEVFGRLQQYLTALVTTGVAVLISVVLVQHVGVPNHVAEGQCCVSGNTSSYILRR
jgi:hypothetical protein